LGEWKELGGAVYGVFFAEKIVQTNLKYYFWVKNNIGERGATHLIAGGSWRNRVRWLVAWRTRKRNRQYFCVEKIVQTNLK